MPTFIQFISTYSLGKLTKADFPIPWRTHIQGVFVTKYTLKRQNHPVLLQYTQDANLQKPKTVLWEGKNSILTPKKVFCTKARERTA